MITLINLFPQHLNLNGDAANVSVLQKRLEWAGVEVRVVNVTSADELQAAQQNIEAHPTSSFICAGHGSLAAMRDLEKHARGLRAILSVARETGVAGIVVGSSRTWIAATEPTRGARISEFTTVNFVSEDWPSKALGYLNSDIAIAPLEVQNNLIVTLLNGPFFAKNPEWANRICALLGAPVTESAKSIRVDSYVEQIWNLEGDSGK